MPATARADTHAIAAQAAGMPPSTTTPSPASANSSAASSSCSTRLSFAERRSPPTSGAPRSSPEKRRRRTRDHPGHARAASLRQQIGLSREELAVVGAGASGYSFLHWHVAFPAVWERGGFDVVLGNPPWERVKLKEKEFFAARSPEIANAPTGAARKRMIEALADDDPELIDAFEAAKRQADGVSHFSVEWPVSALRPWWTSTPTRCSPS